MSFDRNSVMFDHGRIVFTILLVFFLIPLYMIMVSPLDTAFINKLVLVKIGSIFASIFLLSYLVIYWLLRAFQCKNLANFITIFLFYWVLFAGYLFPLGQSPGTVDPSHIPNNKLNFFLVLLCSIFLSVMVRTKLKKGAIVFTMVFLSLSLGSTCYDAYIYYSSIKSLDEQRIDFVKLSKLSNIIVLSLDGIPGSIAYKIIEGNPDLQKQFKDFILFRNVISSSPSTAASIAGELFGNQNFKKIGLTQEDLINNLNKSQLIINQKELNVYTYGSYSLYNINPGTQLSPLASLSELSFASINFYSYVAMRLGTNRLVKIIPYRFIDNLIDKYLINSEIISFKNEDMSLIKRLKNHKGPDWDREYLLDILDLDYISNNISLNSSVKAVRYMHFLFTHFPNNFDEYCHYRADDQIWFDSNQNELGLINETQCALSKLSFFIQRLKSLGIYDNSLIVLKSDHGQPVTYYSTAPDNYKINGNLMWGYNRYRPMLLIKDVNAKNQQIDINDTLVLLDDLAKTICLSDSRKSCNIFPGINLLDKMLPKTRTWYAFVPQNSQSNFMFDSHIAISLRGSDFLNALENNEYTNVN